MKSPLFDSAVDALLTALEEGARASARAVHRFIEPMQGTLRRAQSRRHHLIFGRRGSGKSSLLFKTASVLSEKGHPVAYIDLEPFKGHHYPDVLISVLLATLHKVRRWIDENAGGVTRRRWFTLWLWRHPAPIQKDREALAERINREIDELAHTLHLADGSDLRSRSSSDSKVKDSSGLKATLKANAGPIKDTVEAQIAREVEDSSVKETEETFKRSKIDYLHRKILDYKAIFEDLHRLTGTDGFIFLDDLYHIVRSDQPHLLDYCHRISKGSSFWIKSGTIRHRSTWYIHTPQPIGLKIGDDADEINLDVTLEQFGTARTFLSHVLDFYINEVSAPSRDSLLSDGGLNRLVMASGGVTRDFLGIFRRAVEEARERLAKSPEHARGDKITAEDVNMAAGSYGDRKRDEFKQDTLDDQARLDEAFLKIRRFCLEKLRANIFLIDQEATGADADLVQELIDLRLVHHIKSRVTVSARPGQVYRALLLDVSQYTGERKRRDIQMIDFWTDDRDVLRKASLIFDPSVSMQQLDTAIQEVDHKRHSQTDDSLQGRLNI